MIRAFYLPGWTCQVFQCPVGQKNLLDFGLLVRDQYPDSHYVFTKYLVILLNDWYEKSGCSKRNQNTIFLGGAPSLDPSNNIAVNIYSGKILIM